MKFQTVQALFLWPLFFLFMALLLLAWIYRKRGVRFEKTKKANIFRCVSCKHVYIDTRRVPLSKCPKCNTLNQVIRR